MNPELVSRAAELVEADKAVAPLYGSVRSTCSTSFFDSLNVDLVK